MALLFSVTVVAAADAPVDFGRDIQPLLSGRCYECHGEKKQKSGIRFDRKSTVFKPGDSGKPAIVPGNSATSLLIQRITSTNDDEVMPPKGERLSSEQIAKLRAWIDQGAAWPGADEEKPHWAYQAPARGPVPALTRAMRRVANPIDAFVFARLEREGLAPAAEADRAILLRRVSLDLTGLPPSIEDLDAFATDTSASAYERAVDRLLASPHFGERWARPWLDGARYADTQGYEKDNRRTMWPYRDWVIQALNSDMPFDQFTVEQIAGDMLSDATQDEKVASGFHRNTMTNTEGGTDDEEFRYEALVDRVNTTWGVWMGSTFNCAQCHNHKYDPFTTREYYQFMAFLNNTADTDKDDERPTMKVYAPGQPERLAELRQNVAAADKKLRAAAAKPEIAAALQKWEQETVFALTNWQVLDPTNSISAGGATLTKTASKSIEAGGINPSNDTYTIAAPLAGRVTGIRLEILEAGDEKVLGRNKEGFFVLKQVTAALGTNKLKLAAATADYSQKDYSVTNLLAGTGNGWAVDGSDKAKRVRRSAYFKLASPVEITNSEALTVRLLHGDKFSGANVSRFRLYTTSGSQVGPPALLSNEVRVALLVAVDKRTDKDRRTIREHFEAVAPELKAPRTAYNAAKTAEKTFYDAIPASAVMEELDKPRETRRHVRGAYLTTAEVLTPGTPACMHPFPTNQPLNRLGLARWMVSTNNPLTARVIVNRYWEQIFGRGIVETVEEFGKQGELPSHAELLDWLACEFMEPTVQSGAHPWSVKALLKTIVCSATYRQTSRATPELLARDPYNRLLARGPRVRLEAEMLRDQALAVSGLLSHKIGGPSVMPPQPEGVWQVVYSGDKWETSKGEDKYRRGLYTFWRRTSPHPMLVSFDAPSREYCVLKRNRSDTPLQSLDLLNDPVFVECAQVLARRIALRTELSTEEKVRLLFRAAMARTPSAAESGRLVKLFEQQAANYRADKAAAEKMALGETTKLPAGIDAAEAAAWTVVANVVLNLDEFITKS